MFSPVGQNTSRYPKLTDTQKGLQRIDSVLWDKTYLTENHDTCPLFYPQHFLILKILRITEGFQFRSFSVLWDNKLSIKSRNIPPLGHKIFQYPKHTDTQPGLLRSDSVLWGKKNLDGNTWYPPTLLSLTFFDTKNFVNHRSFPRSKFSGTVRQQTFHRNSWYSTYRHKFYDTTNLLKHRRVSVRIDSVVWDKTIMTENRDLPLIVIKFFDTRNLVNHIRVSLRFDSVQWDKTNMTETRDTRPLFYPERFSIPKYLWITEGFQFRSFSVLWDNKLSIKNRDIPPLGHKIFQYPKHTDTQPGLLRSDSVLWGKTIWTGTRDTRPLFYP